LTFAENRGIIQTEQQQRKDERMYGNEILDELNERLEVVIPSAKDGWPVLVRLTERALEWIENNSDHQFWVDEVTRRLIDSSANVQFAVCVE